MAERSFRVLVADDNEGMRDYIRRVLERYWIVEAVADGATALALARARPPDLVLTDLVMPGLDGLSLLRELQRDERTKQIPVILRSAWGADEEPRVEGLEAGAVDYLSASVSARELVARVRTQLELRRLRRSAEVEREALRATFMQAPVAVAILTGPELVYELANPRYVDLFGREVTGKPIRQAFPEIPADNETFQLLDHVYATGESITEYEHKLAFDRRRIGIPEEWFYRCSCHPIREDGEIRRLVIVAIDVTEQVLARRRLEESEARFSRMVTQAEPGIAQRDLAGRLTFANARYCEIVGRSTDDLQALRIEDITHPDDVATNLEAFRRIADNGEPAVLESRYVRADGSVVWVRKGLSRNVDREGRPVGVTVMMMDITERRRMERELRESETRLKEVAARERGDREEAERAARFSELFVGVLGHDLRNPLAAITTAANMLERRSEDERIAGPVSRIARSASRMAGMIDQLLDFTRIRLGRGLPLSKTRVDLAELARGAVDEIEIAFGRRVDRQTVGDPVGRWDRDRLLQLVSNLVANACEHGAAGSPVFVRIDGAERSNIRLEVHNSGVIPPDVLATIFDPLSRRARAGDRRASSRGLGLGLYISREIALAHRGTIRVDSDETHGTSFLVEMPRDANGVDHVFPGGGDERAHRPPARDGASSGLAVGTDARSTRDG